MHGFARSGSTIVAKQIRDAVGGQDCWVGRTVAAEAQTLANIDRGEVAECDGYGGGGFATAARVSDKCGRA